MKFYYSPDGLSKQGPHSIEQLKAMNLPSTTLFWADGMEHWKKADEIPAFASAPPFAPPLPTSTPIETETPTQGKKLTWLFWLIPLIIALSLGGYFAYRALTTPSEEEVKKQEYNEYKNTVGKDLQEKAEVEEKKIESEEEARKKYWAEAKKNIPGSYGVSLTVDYSDFKGMKVGQVFDETWTFSLAPSGAFKVSVDGGASFTMKETSDHSYSGTYRENTLLGFRDFVVTLNDTREDQTGGFTIYMTKTRKDNDGLEASFSIEGIKE